MSLKVESALIEVAKAEARMSLDEVVHEVSKRLQIGRPEVARSL